MDIIKEIKRLKKEHNAVIIAHNYQLPEVQDIADYLGDSLELSRLSRSLPEKTIIFCGVKFMAETAKILSPEKTVIIPEIDAGCAMAAMTDIDELMKMKQNYPDAKIAAYVNTTAETKAFSDICCTSANAAMIVNSLDTERVIFVPDRNLAAYVASKTDKTIIPYNGYCYVHNQFTLNDIDDARKLHPEAVIFVHPESPREVQEAADYVLSTGGMLKMANNIDKPIIVGTEREMTYRMRKEYPDKTFYVFKENDPPICTNMKKITLNKILSALQDNKYKIDINDNIRERAFQSINAMLSVT